MSWEDKFNKYKNGDFTGRDVVKSGIKVYIWIFVLVILLGTLGFLGKTLFFPVKVANNAIDTAAGVVDKTLNADNALFNYEKFHDLYRGAKEQATNIKNIEANIQGMQDTFGNDPTTWPKDVREELYFQRQTLDGFKMQYQRTVADYNAASKKLNRNLFKDRDLPYELPVDFNQL